MLVKELIERLGKMPQDIEVMILDGFNGGGAPRTINVSPRLLVVEQEDAEDNYDCEDIVGQTVCAMGYGSY